MRAALAAASALLTGLALASSAPACSSWDTGGTSDQHAAERACLDTVAALARAAERCGGEYPRAYDQALVEVAAGDCKNVTGIRDERELRDVCLPSLATEACPGVLAGEHDESCSTQLQRPL